MPSVGFAASIDGSSTIGGANWHRSAAWIGFSVWPFAAFLWFLLVRGTLSDTVRGCTELILLSTLLASTASDLMRRTIPNFITYPAVLWLLVLPWLAESPSTSTGKVAADIQAAGGFEMLSHAVQISQVCSPGEAASGALVCFGLMFVVFMFAGTGGGDVKLAAVIGAALGVAGGLMSLVIAHLIAGVVALSWVVLAFGPLRVARALGRSVGSLLLPVWISPPSPDDACFLRFPLPMSPFLLGGVLFTQAMALSR